MSLADDNDSGVAAYMYSPGNFVDSWGKHANLQLK